MRVQEADEEVRPGPGSSDDDELAITVLAGHDPNTWVAQITCAVSVLPRAAPAWTTPHVPLVCCSFSGAVVTPSGSVFSCQQLPGVCRAEISARSPFVGLAKVPLSLKV